MIPRIDSDGSIRYGATPRSKQRHKSHTERLKAEPWRKQYGQCAYKAERQATIAKANGKCQMCGRSVARFDGTSWKVYGAETHHIVPLRSGGKHSLILLCVRCHRGLDAKLRRNNGK